MVAVDIPTIEEAEETSEKLTVSKKKKKKNEDLDRRVELNPLRELQRLQPEEVVIQNLIE